MTSEQIRLLLRRFQDAMNTRQLDALDDIIAPDFVRHCQATPQQDIRSLDQFKECLRQDAAMSPDNVQTLTHILVEGDQAAVWQPTKGRSWDRWGLSLRQGRGLISISGQSRA